MRDLRLWVELVLSRKCSGKGYILLFLLQCESTSFITFDILPFVLHKDAEKNVPSPDTEFGCCCLNIGLSSCQN